MKQKYILLIILLLASINNVYAQDNNTKESKQPESAQNMKEDPNAKYRTDTVSFAITTSLLGAGYFKGGEAGLLSQTSLEIFAGSPKTTSYFYNVLQVMTPIISPTYNHFFSEIIVDIVLGYGNWVYKNLDSNKKGWIIGLNIGILTGLYSQYFAKHDSSSYGWAFGLGLTANMRAIYQLNRDFGFVIGMDISYRYPFSFITGLDNVHGLTGGITAGIAF